MNDTPERIDGDGLPPELARRLDARLGALPAERAPPPELWHAVAARLPERRPARGRFRALRAPRSAFALAAGLTALAVLLPLGSDVDEPTEAPPLREVRLPAPLGGTAALGEDFLATRSAVNAGYRERLARLDPATRTVVERNLEVLHAALGRIEAALDAEPGDPLLRELLVSTWQQELDYMGRVARLPEPASAAPAGRRIEL